VREVYFVTGSLSKLVIWTWHFSRLARVGMPTAFKDFAYVKIAFFWERENLRRAEENRT
jgi:hypothetical protein